MKERNKERKKQRKKEGRKDRSQGTNPSNEESQAM